MVKRLPEYVATTIRKVEPIGGEMVRLHFAIPRGAAWDDQFTVLMPCAAIPDALGFAMTSAREIANEMMEAGSPGSALQ